MSRSGYIDDVDFDDPTIYLCRGKVARAIRGRRGQAFLAELAETMDAMPHKVLIADGLINQAGDCCAIGVVCKSRGVDVSGVDCDDPEEVGGLVGIARSMAAEIEYVNDEAAPLSETPQQRWCYYEHPAGVSANARVGGSERLPKPLAPPLLFWPPSQPLSSVIRHSFLRVRIRPKLKWQSPGGLSQWAAKVAYADRQAMATRRICQRLYVFLNDQERIVDPSIPAAFKPYGVKSIPWKDRDDFVHDLAA